MEGLCWDVEEQCCGLASLQLLHRLLVLPPNFCVRASAPPPTSGDR